MSVPGKVFAAVTLNRRKEALDKVLRDEKCGFRKSTGCNDQLFALGQIIENAKLNQIDLSLLY